MRHKQSPLRMVAGRALKGPPGEPLFTREEIAAKLGISFETLHGAMTHRPGLEAWHNPHHGVKLYRLSDARKWWNAAA